jgi:hypothetical protein
MKENNSVIPFLAEIESAKGLLNGVINSSQNAPVVINDLIMFFESIAERENPADTWIFAEELQMFLYSKSDDCRDSLVDYKAKLKAKESALVLDLSEMTAESLGTSDAAKSLSDFLNSSDVPQEIYGNILQVLSDADRSTDASRMIEQVQRSPEYIRHVLESVNYSGGAE